jgi:hypothetical protein
VNPFIDALGIIKKDWKLLAILNALFFCVLIIGATIALISPGIHLSMIEFIGADTIAGQSGTPAATSTAGALEAAGMSFISSFFENTLLMITIPSIVLPLWAPIIGAARFFIWGVTFVAPLDGVMTPQNLLPQYIAMILQGEAYIIAIFAGVRQLSVALAASGRGFSSMIRRYKRSVIDNLKLLLIVIVLLAIAALYQALVIPILYGIL